MNILHLDSSPNWGGQEYRTCLEVLWLRRHGHRAWLACLPGTPVASNASTLGVPLLPLSLTQRVDPIATFELFRFCRRERIDVLHPHGSKDHWLCLPLHWAGRPVVRSRHITTPLKPRWNRAFIFRHGADRIIATAGLIKAQLIEAYGLVPEKIDVIGEGVDLTEYHPGQDGSAFRREFGIPADAPLLGIIAMIRGDKGHLFFLEAALLILETHPQARFVIVGEGTGARELEKELRRRIETSGAAGRIIMTGYRWDIPQVMAALDVVVVASVAVEAQSRIVPQAFATRRAVIATRCGGLAELVADGGNGLLVPPADTDALRQAMVRLIEHPVLREQLGTAGHTKAQCELSLDLMMERTLTVYHKVLDC